MRVVSGKYKGRRLASVKGANARYTSDRVKESLFSILRNVVPGTRFLDLFAGSGNVGIEALSRGAEFVTFVELNKVCTKTILANLTRCGLSPQSPSIILLNMGISRAMEYFRRRKIQFDIIFLDPPYRLGLVKKSLKDISNYGILPPDGVVITEHDVKEDVPKCVGNLVMIRQERYGTTLLSFHELLSK